jgi:hypothetical protein
MARFSVNSLLARHPLTTGFPASQARSPQGNPPRIVGAADWPAIRRRSDNWKFCSDPNGPKTLKMSERPLKTIQDFPTSKLNTRVRFPSPAPAIATCARSGRLDAGAVGDALFLEPASVGDRGCIGAGWNFRARLQRQQRGALVFKDDAILQEYQLLKMDQIGQ